MRHALPCPAAGPATASLCIHAAYVHKQPRANNNSSAPDAIATALYSVRKKDKTA